MCSLIRDREVQLPDCVYDPIADHYARRELYRSPRLGYSVVAMTWGPGQGTPIHDHSGLWCVEGVWDGQLEITQYETARDATDERIRFRAAGGMQAGPGSAGSLIPAARVPQHPQRQSGRRRHLRCTSTRRRWNAARCSCRRTASGYHRAPRELATDEAA
jgi:hypothetical protein